MKWTNENTNAKWFKIEELAPLSIKTLSFIGKKKTLHNSKDKINRLTLHWTIGNSFVKDIKFTITYFISERWHRIPSLDETKWNCVLKVWASK